jgi:hypothetical protein
VVFGYVIPQQTKYPFQSALYWLKDGVYTKQLEEYLASCSTQSELESKLSVDSNLVSVIIYFSNQALEQKIPIERSDDKSIFKGRLAYGEKDLVRFEPYPVISKSHYLLTNLSKGKL